MSRLPSLAELGNVGHYNAGALLDATERELRSILNNDTLSGPGGRAYQRKLLRAAIRRLQARVQEANEAFGWNLYDPAKYGWPE